MSYSLLIDYRESYLKEYFESYDFSKDKNLNKVNLIVKNLDLGDIIIKKKDEIILIIERKTLQDLYSSINDGRYKEQKVRLKSNFDDNQIVYIIEDSNTKFINNKFKNVQSIIDGAILNSVFRDNIKVLRTKSVDETIIYIKTLLKKIINNFDFFVNPKVNMKDNISNNYEKECIKNEIQNDPNIKIVEIKSKEKEKEKEKENNYVDNIKIKKKENNNPENCSIIMLCQIPGVSTKISKTVFNNYTNISNLVIEYNKLIEIKDKEQLLKDLSFEINNDKTRKIGPVISKRIYNYLFS
jgi:ERCC4-type nuclease